jgi:demethylmenaquinone methyltransferase/2-methoxy-6-polyprenyl-1,4-benzoquinol methylase
MFRRVAPRYDFLNHALSGGLDWYWRRVVVQAVRAQGPARLLDLATGTGDVALALLRAGAVRGRCVGADFCAPMLRRAQHKGLAPLCVADGLQLPFATGSFAAVTIAFGLRNLEDRLQGLREIRRMLRPEGKLYVLEFSQPVVWWRGLYFWYLQTVLPRVAALLGAHEASYVYLGQSIRAFPSPDELSGLMQEAGFGVVHYRRLTGGMVVLHEAMAA